MPRNFRNELYRLGYGEEATAGWPAVFRAIISKTEENWVHNLATRNALVYLIMLYEHDEGETACPTMVLETEDGMLLEKRDGEVIIEILCMPNGVVEQTFFVGGEVVESKSLILGPLQVPPVIPQHFGTINRMRESYATTARANSVLPTGPAGSDNTEGNAEWTAPVVGDTHITGSSGPAVAVPQT